MVLPVHLDQQRGLEARQRPYRRASGVELVEFVTALVAGLEVAEDRRLLLRGELAIEVGRQFRPEVEGGEEPLGDFESRQRSHRSSRFFQTAELENAIGTTAEVLDNMIEFAGVELTVEVGGHQLTDIAGRGGQIGHVSSSLSIFRPRWIRLRTVPTGESMAVAISS